jgi:hypothetical protein
MDFDLDLWLDESEYAQTEFSRNQLRSKVLSTCLIGIGGSSGFYPPADDLVRLGSVDYEVSSFEDEVPGEVVAYYFEEESLAEFDYDREGLPAIQLRAMQSEWMECRRLAEPVLATLRVPDKEMN